MAEEKTHVDVPIKPEEFFIESYKKLVEETGYRLEPVPSMMKRDDGTYSFVVRMAVTKAQRNK